MSGFLIPSRPTGSRRTAAFLLALSFLSGLCFGALTSFDASHYFIPAMRVASKDCVSIIGLLSALLLPFLFSAIAVYIKKPALLYLIAFCQAFLLAFVGAGVLLSFGSAGWLMRLLMMFSGILFLPLLYWYWLKNVTASFGLLHSGVLILLPGMLAISLIDYYYVAPLLAKII